MELRQLRYFLTIADQGSFSKAAGELGIAQSSLSEQMTRLEKDLGVTLFRRSTLGVTLTESARIFYEQARAVLQKIETARAVVTGSSRNPAGTVLLGMPQTVSGVLALPLLLAAKKMFPNVELRITEELTRDLVERLRQGRTQLAILIDDGQLEEFVCRPIARDKL